MAGRRFWGYGLLGLLGSALPPLAIGCSGSAERNEQPATGGAATGGADATGGQGNANSLTKLFSSTGALCDKLAECYPALQTPGAATCLAPASGDRQIVYQNPVLPEMTVKNFQTCVDEYPDQAELAVWLKCQTDAVDANLACYESCPADGEACSISNNAAIDVCHALPINAKLKVCYDAGR